MAPVKCEKGTYSPEGYLGCHNCSVGHFCPTEGLHEQRLCPSGSYALNERQHRCDKCPIGMIVDFRFDY